MAGVARGGIIWTRVDLAQERYAGTGAEYSQVGILSCAKVRQTVLGDNAREKSPLRGKSY